MFGAVMAFVGRNKLVVGVAAALGIALALYVVYSAVRESGRDDIRREDAVAVGESKVKGASAREAAAGERASDAAAVAAQHEERTNAAKGYPDAPPSDRARSRRCVQLRQQGHDTSGIPECGGRPPGP